MFDKHFKAEELRSNIKSCMHVLGYCTTTLIELSDLHLNHLDNNAVDNLPSETTEVVRGIRLLLVSTVVRLEQLLGELNANV